MEVLFIVLGLIAFGVAFYVWKNEKLELFKIEEAAMINMTEKDKNDVIKSLSSPIALLGVLLISLAINADKWGLSFVLVVIGIIGLFIVVEKRTINGINTTFKAKKLKTKINKKRR